MASGDSSQPPDLPRGLIGRRGTPTGKAARLPSLRGPRDLTLGGIPKKVFAPKIPARRDKAKQESESEPQASSQESKSKDTKGRDGKSERGRGRGRGRGAFNVVQSHSIFEQGPADRRGGGRGGSGSYSGDRDSTARPIGTSKVTVKKADEGETQKVLDHLLRDDFIDDEVSEDLTMTPVKLPLGSAIKKEEKEEEVGVKVEPGTDVEMKEDLTKPKVWKSDASKTKEKTCRDLFSKTRKTEAGELLFFQLPDVLPGTPAGKGEDEVTVKTEPGQSRSSGKSKEEEPISKSMANCTLNDFSEGYVGKLVIRKSGRAQLMLGNTMLDVSMGTPCGFLQDLVSVRVNNNSGHMTVLAHVNERLVCTPDFESLLQLP